MRICELNRLKNAFLALLFLLGCGVVANRYSTESGLSDPYHTLLARVPDIVSRQFAGEASAPISHERNAIVLTRVFEVFDPSLRPFLAAVPIVLESSADTAKAYPAKGTIAVSPDWDNTVLRSRYRAIYEQRGMQPDDPVFMDRFKVDLLTHEFLHLLQAHLGIDSRLFYAAVARWYLDPRYGIPSPGGVVAPLHGGSLDAVAGNRMKYILWHALYNHRSLNDVPRDQGWKSMQYGERYRRAAQGVEEFAYIGQEILASRSDGGGSESDFKAGWSEKDWKSKQARMREVSPEVREVFGRVFNPILTR